MEDAGIFRNKYLVAASPCIEFYRIKSNKKFFERKITKKLAPPEGKLY